MTRPKAVISQPLGERLAREGPWVDLEGLDAATRASVSSFAVDRLRPELANRAPGEVEQTRGGLRSAGP